MNHIENDALFMWLKPDNTVSWVPKFKVILDFDQQMQCPMPALQSVSTAEESFFIIEFQKQLAADLSCLTYLSIYLLRIINYEMT